MNHAFLQTVTRWILVPYAFFIAFAVGYDYPWWFVALISVVFGGALARLSVVYLRHRRRRDPPRGLTKISEAQGHAR